MTGESDVVAARRELSSLKDKFGDAIKAYVVAASSSKSDATAKSAVLEIQKSGAAYFNYAEEFVGNSDLLGAHKSDLWAQGFAEDCVEILGSMPGHYKFLKTAFQQIPEFQKLDIAPGQTAFANMQRMVVEYLNSRVAKDLHQRFLAAELPVYGFENKVTSKSSFKLKTVLAYVFGFVMVVIVLVLVLALPEPSRFQRAVIWAILAMALAGVASVIPGFIEVNLRKWIVAGGALAVFVVVYFFAPADPEQKADGSITTTPPGSQPKGPAIKEN